MRIVLGAPTNSDQNSDPDRARPEPSRGKPPAPEKPAQTRARPGLTQRVRVQEIRAGSSIRRDDRLAVEEPLEIRLEWPSGVSRVAVTMRTPGHDFELAAGLVVLEGLCRRADIASVVYCADPTITAEQKYNVVTVKLQRPPLRVPDNRPDTVTAVSAACGVCGTESIAGVLRHLESSQHHPHHHLQPETTAVAPAVTAQLSAATIHALPQRLRNAQRIFGTTGGLHAAGLFTIDGTLVEAREDIGRHNAVDKVVGARLLMGADMDAPILCVSGRVGFEIAAKAVAANVCVLVALGAPSSISLELARRGGIGLIGFANADRFVVYHQPTRVELRPDPEPTG